MSRLIVVVLAILGIRSAFADDACKKFLGDSKFDSSALDGTWAVVYIWPPSTVKNTPIFHYKAVSSEKVKAFKNEMASFYPPYVSWDKIKYEVNFNEHINNKEVSFLLEVLGDTGYVNGIPSGDAFLQSLLIPEPLQATRFAYRRVGDYLAAKFCGDMGEKGWLMHQGTEHDADDVEKMAFGVSATMSKLEGGLAVFLKRTVENA